MKAWRRWLFWGVLLVLLCAGLAYALWPRPIPVDIVTVSRSPMMLTVDEEGETRVKEAFVVSAPITGNVLRIAHEVGDPVVAGKTELARIEPVDPSFLDARTRAQAEAAVRAAEAALAYARAELKRQLAELEFARTEYDRARALFERNASSKRALDDARRARKTRLAAVDTARANVNVKTFELERAKLQLLPPGAKTKVKLGPCGCVPVVSPVSGRILQIFHKSAGVVTAGEKLVEVGDPNKLEIVADLLSADAVRVRPGQRVIIDNWGGDVPLTGRVLRVDPLGRTKVSALGIEEQRVDVVIDFTPPKRPDELGHGFRVDVRIVLWEAKDVLSVPLSALFRVGERWAVFAVVDGRARRRIVKIGRKTDRAAQVLDGLKVGDAVIAHPSDRVSDGARVAQRQTE